MINTERTTPRDNKPAAIKVELETVWDRVSVLKNKSKCNAKKKTANVRIHGCEEHADRVNRLNSMQLLKLMGKDKEFVIVGNGVIKSKAELKSSSQRSSQGNGRGGSSEGLGAKHANGDASGDVIAADKKNARGRGGDNTSDTGSGKNNNKPSTARKDPNAQPNGGVAEPTNDSSSSSDTETDEEAEEDDYNSARGSMYETDTESAEPSTKSKATKSSKQQTSLQRQAVDHNTAKEDRKKKR